MSDSTAVPAAHGVRPGQPAPELIVDLLSGGSYDLADRKPAAFAMVVFFRGLHCPVCQVQLRELDRRLDELRERGVDVVAISGDTRERTEQIRDAWRLERLALGYGLSEEQMRAWGLFVSHGITDNEPPVFNEPGLFLIKPGGTVYYESILSMPVGRPRLDDVLAGIDYWTAHDHPARGEA
jgi:peroxiredoxin